MNQEPTRIESDKLPKGRVMNIADTGHFMPMEKPDYVAEQAVEFLSAT